MNNEGKIEDMLKGFASFYCREAEAFKQNLSCPFLQNCLVLKHL